MKTLVIDDSRATRALVRQMLESMGSKVVEAENGEQALECLQQGGVFQLALVDWNMPVMNGYNFLLEVRKEAQYDAASRPPMSPAMITPTLLFL